jgi:hypothetical protein
MVLLARALDRADVAQEVCDPGEYPLVDGFSAVGYQAAHLSLFQQVPDERVHAEGDGQRRALALGLAPAAALALWGGLPRLAGGQTVVLDLVWADESSPCPLASRRALTILTGSVHICTAA